MELYRKAWMERGLLEDEKELGTTSGKGSTL
jgi:hypothetical protein